MHQVCDGRGCFIYRVLCCPFVLPLGMHHCSSWKLFLLYCWWAKSRRPQVISQISMDIPQMTVFELFELFESSQLVTSVGCLQKQLHWSQKLSYPRIWHAFYIYCFHCCHSYLSWLCMPACFKGMCWDDFEETQLVTPVWQWAMIGKLPTFQDPEFPPNDNSLGKLKGDTVPWPNREQAATGAVVLWYTGLRCAEAGGYVHQGGGTEWIKASEIAEKDRFVAEELRSPSTCW